MRREGSFSTETCWKWMHFGFFMVVVWQSFLFLAELNGLRAAILWMTAVRTTWTHHTIVAADRLYTGILFILCFSFGHLFFFLEALNNCKDYFIHNSHYTVIVPLHSSNTWMIIYIVFRHQLPEMARKNRETIIINRCVWCVSPHRRVPAPVHMLQDGRRYGVVKL